MDQKVKESRADRKARLEESRKAQHELDTEAVNELEITHGDSNIAVVEVPFTDGLPVLVACRTPKPIEIKRYRLQISDATKPGKQQDTSAVAKAAEVLATICCVYPEREVLEKMAEARPLLLVTMCKSAVALADASAESEGKS